MLNSKETRNRFLRRVLTSIKESNKLDGQVIEQEFYYEPSEIIQALLEGENFKKTERNKFKKRKLKNLHEDIAFSSNAHKYIEKRETDDK
jgi:rubrerythrin